MIFLRILKKVTPRLEWRVRVFQRAGLHVVVIRLTTILKAGIAVQIGDKTIKSELGITQEVYLTRKEKKNCSKERSL